VTDSIFCLLECIKIITGYSNQNFTNFGRIFVNSLLVEQYCHWGKHLLRRNQYCYGNQKQSQRLKPLVNTVVT